jgi:hypothetical protein
MLGSNNFVFKIYGLWLSKNAELNVDSKYIILPYLQNAPKKLLQNKDFRTAIYTRGPLYTDENL